MVPMVMIRRGTVSMVVCLGTVSTERTAPTGRTAPTERTARTAPMALMALMAPTVRTVWAPASAR